MTRLALYRNFAKLAIFIARFSPRFAMSIWEAPRRGETQTMCQTKLLLITGYRSLVTDDWLTSSHFLHFPHFPSGNKRKWPNHQCANELGYLPSGLPSQKLEKGSAASLLPSVFPFLRLS